MGKCQHRRSARFHSGTSVFLIYINDLSGDLSSKAKLFAGETSLFNVTHDINATANELNNDLKKVGNWASQWKMSLNLIPSKQAQEVRGWKLFLVKN